MSERPNLEKYFEQSMREKTPREILARVRLLLPKRTRVTNWVLAKDVYGVGSTFAHWICHEHGIDPDGVKITPYPANPTKAEAEE